MKSHIFGWSQLGFTVVDILFGRQGAVIATVLLVLVTEWNTLGLLPLGAALC